MRHTRLIVMAIVMMAAAAPARAQGHHGAAPAHGASAAAHDDKPVKAAAPAPAAAAKTEPATATTVTSGTSALDAVARIAKRLDEELGKPKGKTAGRAGPGPGNTHAGPARSGGAARGARTAERPRVKLEWRLSVAWTAAADALNGQPPPAEESAAPPPLLEACANPLHVHLDAGPSHWLLQSPVLPNRPAR